MTTQAQKASQPARYQVGEVQPQMYSGFKNGFGFVISNARSAPLTALTYETEAEAEQAREAIKSAIQNAVDIIGYNV